MRPLPQATSMTSPPDATAPAQRATHREGGYFAAYGGTSPATFEECLALVRTEFAKVRREGVSEAELMRAKNQFRGALIMAQESMSSRMNRLGKSEIYFGEVIPLAEALAKIEAVTVQQVLEIAQAVLPESSEGLTVAAIGPFDEADKEALAEIDVNAVRDFIGTIYDAPAHGD